jgi:hypothetical protein
MGNRLVREGSVQSVSQADASRDKVYNGITTGMIRTAGDDKAEKKEEKAKDKAEKKEQKFKDKMTKKEAEELGFFKAAKACGWGIYQVSDLDGGQGSVWYLEKGADGTDYLVKQVDSAGEVIRRVKTASKATVPA